MTMTTSMMIFITTITTIVAMRVHRLNSGAGKGQQRTNVVPIRCAQGADIAPPQVVRGYQIAASPAQAGPAQMDG